MSSEHLKADAGQHWPVISQWRMVGCCLKENARIETSTTVNTNALRSLATWRPELHLSLPSADAIIPLLVHHSFSVLSTNTWLFYCWEMSTQLYQSFCKFLAAFLNYTTKFLMKLYYGVILGPLCSSCLICHETGGLWLGTAATWRRVLFIISALIGLNCGSFLTDSLDSLYTSKGSSMSSSIKSDWKYFRWSCEGRSDRTLRWWYYFPVSDPFCLSTIHRIVWNSLYFQLKKWRRHWRRSWLQEYRASGGRPGWTRSVSPSPTPPFLSFWGKYSLQVMPRRRLWGGFQSVLLERF